MRRKYLFVVLVCVALQFVSMMTAPDDGLPPHISIERNASRAMTSRSIRCSETILSNQVRVHSDWFVQFAD
jgi:hypothetical protein